MKYVHVLKSNPLPSEESEPPCSNLESIKSNTTTGKTKQDSKDKPEKIDIVPSILKHTDSVLIPLTDVFDVALPVVGRIEDFHTNVVDFKSKYSLYNPKIWIDSGGFAFIKGTIPANNVGNLIDLYATYLSKFESDFYRIFSLDLPFNNKDSSFNNPKSIYEANKKSLNLSLQKIMQTQGLSDKFIFVMHFLQGESYSIWSRIYKNLNLSGCIKNRALGGMVGVRAGTKNVLSPFLAATFKAYIDFLAGRQISGQNTFNLHFLGINSVHDRFAIALLEKLFADYLLVGGATTYFSYDNSIFSEAARKGNKKLSALIEGKRLGLYYLPGYRFIDPRDLVNIYDTNLTAVVEKNLENWIDKGNVENTAIFEPINIHGQVQMDKLLSGTVEKFKIIDAIWHCNTEVKFEKYVDSLLPVMSHGHDLSSEYSEDKLAWIEATLFDNENFKVCLKKNLMEIFRLHKWITKPKNTYKGIDIIMRNYNKRWFVDRDSNPSGLPPKT